MNQTDRDYPELAPLTHQFSAGTRGRITRALLRVLRGHSYQSAATLLLAVRDASRELRVQGLADHAVLTILGVLVEETGRACGASRPSLMSGEPRWMQVRTRVLELASGVLTRDTHNTLTSKRAVSSTVRAASLIALGVSLTACASLNKKEQGAIIGGAVGGTVGAVVGNQTGSTARGAIIGAVVGGVAGGIIGHQMDQQAKELQQNIAGATVERVGEGIQVTFASGLLYDIDSDRVRAEAAQNLRNLATSLGKYPNTDLLIVGHTDSTGTSAYNQSLSERRARAASDYLATQGVSVARLRTSGRGESEPLASNSAEAGRQLNRRVEVAIFANARARAGGAPE